MCQALLNDQQPAGSGIENDAGTETVRVPASAEEHIKQYTHDMADFFDQFNAHTHRPLSYQGYIGGLLANSPLDLHTNSDEETIAIDFGCGTGWLAQFLCQKDYNFSRVYGIDTSLPMVRLAHEAVKKNVRRGNKDQSKIVFRSEIPESIFGRASLVVAAHLHYHFGTEERLSHNFFGAISSALRVGGEFLLIGCPSEGIRNSPAHYKNSILAKDVPAHVRQDASSLEALQDMDGYIKLEDLPRFALPEGQPMKATFYITEPGRTIERSVKDTYWSDKKLISVAEKNGLDFISQTDLPYEPCQNAYMIQRYRKVANHAMNQPG